MALKETIPGTLIVAAAPIGCAGDASARLGAALAGAAVIAAEDTRRIRRLAADLGVRLTRPFVSCYGAVAQRRVGRALAEARAGGPSPLATDARPPRAS